MHHPDILVLIVDDDDDQIFFIERAARKAGGLVLLTAANGWDALELLRARERGGEPPPDVIVTDLKMPVLGGFELLLNLREFEYVRHVPRIVLTSSTSPADESTAVLTGADGFVPKPMNLTALVAFLRGLARYSPHQEQRR